MELPESAESFHAICADEGISLLLAGGWAVNHHGYGRMTRDVDWICSRELESPLRALMARIHFTAVAEGMATRFVRPSAPAFPPLDVIWVDAATFAKMATTNERTGRHRSIPVIRFDHLLTMKIVALRDDEHRLGRDLLDIRQLLAQNPNVINDDELAQLCVRYGPPGALARILDPKSRP